jgi:hypothetical protein
MKMKHRQNLLAAELIWAMVASSAHAQAAENQNTGRLDRALAESPERIPLDR